MYTVAGIVATYYAFQGAALVMVGSVVSLDIVWTLADITHGTNDIVQHSRHTCARTVLYAPMP